VPSALGTPACRVATWASTLAGLALPQSVRRYVLGVCLPIVDMEDGIHSLLLHVGAGGVHPGGEGNLGGLLIRSNVSIGWEPLSWQYLLT
jgi:hypothetical protein